MSANTEIQIKWQDPKVRGARSYHLGDILEEVEDEYNNTWIRTDFICNVCSKLTRGWKGIEYIKTDDQSRHVIFVRLENGRIREILSEEDFYKVGVRTFVDYL